MSLLSVAINKQSYEGWRGFVVGVIPISMRMVSGDPTCMLPGERVSTRVHKLPLLLTLVTASSSLSFLSHRVTLVSCCIIRFATAGKL